MKNLLYVFIFITVSCSEVSQVKKESVERKFELTDKVFSFGPILDSVNTEVIAECDCCESEILFKKDSSFIAVFYCLEGDSYAKGKFQVDGDKLTLNFVPMEVVKLNDLEAEYDSSDYQKTSNFQVTAQQIPKSTLNISVLKTKTVLTTNGEEKDFGIESKGQTKNSFLNILRKDSVLYYLKVE